MGSSSEKNKKDTGRKPGFNSSPEGFIMAPPVKPNIPTANQVVKPEDSPALSKDPSQDPLLLAWKKYKESLKDLDEKAGVQIGFSNLEQAPGKEQAQANWDASMDEAKRVYREFLSLRKADESEEEFYNRLEALKAADAPECLFCQGYGWYIAQGINGEQVQEQCFECDFPPKKDLDKANTINGQVAF